MCTAVSFRTKDHYFGRTLDFEYDYGAQVAVTPRNFPLPFRHMGTLGKHYAIIGMARVERGYPLYFDGVNEKGLAVAGLNFVHSACYHPTAPGKENVAHFELIPWLLAQCATVAEAKKRLERLNITDDAFCDALPPAKLHWLLADGQETVVIESVGEGLRVMDDPAGVLTNEPPFPMQLQQLQNFLNLSSNEPESRFSPSLELMPYSRGMGAIGLPGDLSSPSRFVRAAFVRSNSVCGSAESESVSQFFHILGSVTQPRGCCRLGDGQYEITVYTSCCNTDRGIYYYTTYGNRAITAVDLRRENLDGTALSVFDLVKTQQFLPQNG